jgi:hypothetical protein
MSEEKKRACARAAIERMRLSPSPPEERKRER